MHQTCAGWLYLKADTRFWTLIWFTEPANGMVLPYGECQLIIWKQVISELVTDSLVFNIYVFIQSYHLLVSFSRIIPSYDPVVSLTCIIQSYHPVVSLTCIVRCMIQSYESLVWFSCIIQLYHSLVSFSCMIQSYHSLVSFNCIV